MDAARGRDTVDPRHRRRRSEADEREKFSEHPAGQEWRTGGIDFSFRHHHLSGGVLSKNDDEFAAIPGAGDGYGRWRVKAFSIFDCRLPIERHRKRAIANQKSKIANGALMSAVLEPPVETIDKQLEELDTVTIRFAGDSGDGMQLTGTQFTNTSAIVGNDISTLPDFPAEIRAPAGSLP